MIRRRPDAWSWTTRPDRWHPSLAPNSLRWPSGARVPGLGRRAPVCWQPAWAAQPRAQATESASRRLARRGSPRQAPMARTSRASNRAAMPRLAAMVPPATATTRGRAPVALSPCALTDCKTRPSSTPIHSPSPMTLSATLTASRSRRKWADHKPLENLLSENIFRVQPARRNRTISTWHAATLVRLTIPLAHASWVWMTWRLWILHAASMALKPCAFATVPSCHRWCLPIQMPPQLPSQKKPRT